MESRRGSNFVKSSDKEKSVEDGLQRVQRGVHRLLSEGHWEKDTSRFTGGWGLGAIGTCQSSSRLRVAEHFVWEGHCL